MTRFCLFQGAAGPSVPAHKSMLHFRISRFAGSLLALLCLSVIGVSRSQAQTLTYSFTTGTNPGAVSPATGLLVFTPDETVSLVSFSYLGTDGITPLANGQLFYVELPLGTDFSSLSEEETYGALSIGVSTGASIVDGAWVFPASSLQFTPDHTYWLYTDGNVGGVGIGESGDGRNGGVTWIGFAVQGGNYFNYSLAATPVPEPATYAIFAGVLVLGVTVLWRRGARRLRQES